MKSDMGVVSHYWQVYDNAHEGTIGVGGLLRSGAVIIGVGLYRCIICFFLYPSLLSAV
jgi:hypothetical protein